MKKSLGCFMWYECSIQIEAEILSNNSKIDDVVWNRMLDSEEPTQE